MQPVALGNVANCVYHLLVLYNSLCCATPILLRLEYVCVQAVRPNAVVFSMAAQYDMCRMLDIFTSNSYAEKCLLVESCLDDDDGGELQQRVAHACVVRGFPSLAAAFIHRRVRGAFSRVTDRDLAWMVYPCMTSNAMVVVTHVHMGRSSAPSLHDSILFAVSEAGACISGDAAEMAAFFIGHREILRAMSTADSMVRRYVRRGLAVRRLCLRARKDRRYLSWSAWHGVASWLYNPPLQWFSLNAFTTTN